MKYYYGIVTEPEKQEIMVLLGECESTESFVDAISAPDGSTVEFAQISKANYEILERLADICEDSPKLKKRLYYMIETLTDTMREGEANEESVRNCLLSAEIMLGLFKKYPVSPDLTIEQIQSMLQVLDDELENSVNVCETLTLSFIGLQLRTMLEFMFDPEEALF